MSKFAARWFAVLLLAAGVGMQVGCRACGSCHDYSSPVANCECSSCDCSGGGRAGSVSTGGGCTQGGCTQGGCPTGDCYGASEAPAGDAIDQAVEFAQRPTHQR